LNLIVLPSYYFEKEAGICEGDTFYWQGMALDSTGTYSVQYSTVENCDSNYLLNLSVFPSYSFEEAAEICSSDTFYWQGMYLNESGTYQVNYTTINDCDSSYQLILTVLPSYYFEEEAGICEGDTFYWQGMTLDSAGTYSVQYSTVENCDSNYLLNLSVLPSYSFEETAEICSADTFYWQGMALIESGTYQVDYTTVNECDSSYQLTLTVLPSYYFEEEASICEGDTFYWQGMILDSAGTYSAKYSTIENCDSIFKITLEEIILDDTISQSGDTLFAKYDSAASYQWVNCPGYDTITGANESTYITTESGQYAVIIEKDGCSKISECINVVNSGLVSHENENEVKIYPNPVKDNYIYIETGETTSDYIIIRDFTGKNVEKHITKSNITRINISNLSQGIYFISIFTGKKIINKKFVVIK
ncbi:MAG TPA: T9SS type A sorting domain-containing protein, partial [Bacteroidetes bacterium]|nr:T9SS type A sorting domain-containing protein [Bacteroidota bacterium]